MFDLEDSHFRLVVAQALRVFQYCLASVAVESCSVVLFVSVVLAAHQLHYLLDYFYSYRLQKLLRLTR